MRSEPASPNPGEPDLNAALLDAGLAPVTALQAAKFDTYLKLILRWNARMNLTAVRDAEGILHRHFVESIACAQFLPVGIRSLLDFGSGAGLPGIPIALYRSEIEVTLAESHSRKAAFLQEAVRVLELNSRVWPKRAEELRRSFDCVVLRAVDDMERAVASAAVLVTPRGWLGTLTTTSGSAELRRIAGHRFEWSTPKNLHGSNQRLLELGKRIK